MTSFSLRRFAGVLCILFLAACGKSELYHGLSEREANEFIVRLNAANIAAEKMLEEGRNPTYKVLVEADKMTSAFQVLETYNLPRQKAPGIMGVYPPGSLIPGPYEERAKFLLAVTGEIEMTLEAIDGVVEVRVHVVLPEVDVLRDDDENPPRPTAAVFLKYLPDAEGKKPFNDEEVKQLVWRSVEGIKDTNDITIISKAVVLPSGAIPTPGESVAMTAEGTAGMMSLEACMETYKEQLGGSEEMMSVGPLKVAKSSYRMLLIILSGMGVVILVLLVLWLMAFLSASSLKRKLHSSSQKKRKSS